MQAFANLIRKLIFPTLLIFLTILLFVAINYQFGFTYNSSPLTAQTKRICVPTPVRSLDTSNLPRSIYPPTLRPDMGLTTPEIGPASTPLPISKVTDLSAGSPEEEKAYVYVMHCDGSIELFKVKPTGDKSADVHLQADDFLYAVSPAVQTFGHQPPKGPFPTDIPSKTQIPMNGAYPPPATPTRTATNLPYP